MTTHHKASQEAKVSRHSENIPSTISRIRCTYPNCNYWFTSDKAMKGHKASFPEHDYCSKCDMDFKNEDQFLIHKIKSKKHIVCPICGTDFGSEGGRDRHIRQFHRSTQNLTCFGCKSTFRSASGLMRHIEEGECVEISQDRLLYEQSKKLMRKEALELSMGSGGQSLVDLDDEPEGGVQLSGMALRDKNREAMANQPGQMGGNENTYSLIDDHWPKLSENLTGLEDAMSDLMDFSPSDTKDKGKKKEDSGWKGKGRVHSAGSEGGSDAASGATARISAAVIGPPDTGVALGKIYKDWDVNNFIDPFTGDYVCPCGRRCNTKEGFEKHVLLKSQGARRMQCPGCLKIFKSTAALISHWESPTIKCDVSDGDLYAQIMDEVSGGMIQIAGYNDDGTMRYEAGKLELQKKTTIGVDLDKVRW
ncbi:hypothetical protein BDV18DRAFT_103522 [Aspergillus unguis]